MRPRDPHTPPSRLGWLWMVCAEARDPRQTRRGQRPVEVPNEILDSRRSSWENWLLGRTYINEDRSIQAALREGPQVAEWICLLSESFHPLRWTFGLGFGEVRGEKDEEGRVHLGGAAVDEARQALWEARRHRGAAVVRGIGAAEAGALASLFDLQSEIRRRWTLRQAETVVLARSHSGREVAEILGVGPSVVSECLSAASYRALRRSETAAAQLLGCYGGRLHLDLEGERLCFPSITESVGNVRPQSLVSE